MGESGATQARSTIRRKVLAAVGAMIVVSVVGSTVTLYRITDVSRLLVSINGTSVPLGKLLAQMKSDVEILNRELEKRLSHRNWHDAHWRAQPVPGWIQELLFKEVERARELVEAMAGTSRPQAHKRWVQWVDGFSNHLDDVRVRSARLYSALEQGDEKRATEVYPTWVSSRDAVARELAWALDESERSARLAFGEAEGRVSGMRLALQAILAVIMVLSILILWVGERALRPLAEITHLVRGISERGLRKEDKGALPHVSLTGDDEVGQLAREFHHMATTLLEREKTVESQTLRLQDQNRMLQESNVLNRNILDSIPSVMVVTDLEGRIRQCNSAAERFFGRPVNKLLAQSLNALPESLSLGLSGEWDVPQSTRTLETREVRDRQMGGRLVPLRGEQGAVTGAILVLEDFTEQRALEQRLRQIENLAAVGRLSAQVAHEVRNPLHSIGLEAEMACEIAERVGDSKLREAIQSILVGVDRLESITQNYLKLSRPDSTQKVRLNLADVLESVLATYSSICAAKNVRVNWIFADEPMWVKGDPILLEQALGNLHRNALQAIEETAGTGLIHWELLHRADGRVVARITDSGPGVPAEIEDRLFTPFFTTKAQGTGLGLSYIRKVIEEHGGEISLVKNQDRSGHGACFEISLMPEEVRFAEHSLSG